MLYPSYLISVMKSFPVTPTSSRGGDFRRDDRPMFNHGEYIINHFNEQKIPSLCFT